MVHHTYEIGGFPFSLRATSQHFGDWVAGVLASYRVEDKPISESDDEDEDAVRYSIAVAEPSSQRPGKGVHVLYNGTSPIARTTDLATLRRALIEEVARFRYPERDDAIFLDAMLLGTDRHIAIVASNFFPRLVRVRRRLERAGLRLALSRSVAVDPESGKVIPADPGLDLPRAAASDLRAGGNGSLILDGPAQASSVIVSWESTNHMFHRVSRGHGLYELSRTVMNLPQVGSSSLEGIRRLVEGASVYEMLPVQVTDFVDAAAVLLESPRAPQPVGAGSA